jgi:peptide chain release factor subunit 1
MSDEDLAKYEFKHALDQLQAIKGRGTEMISLYIPPKKVISDVMNYLRNEAAQSENIKSRVTRSNVTSAIESLMSHVRLYKTPPENGVVIFVGSKPVPGGQTQLVVFTVVPPEPVPTFYYKCDHEFFLEPLLNMLKEKETFGLIVIDKNEATIGFLRGKHIEPYKTFESLVPGKTRRGGQSSARYARLRDIALHEFFVKVGDAMNAAFLAETEMKGVLIGSPARITSSKFLEGDYIHHELRKIIIDQFDVGYTDDFGLRELVENAAERLGEIALNKERKIVDRFKGELVKPDAGLASYGTVKVLRDLVIGAVEVLLVSDGLNKQLVKYKCKTCNNIWYNALEVPQPAKCPDDQGEGEVLGTTELVKGLSELVKGYGTTMEIISAESDQGSQLLKAFGGMAAILRYKTRH